MLTYGHSPLGYPCCQTLTSNELTVSPSLTLTVHGSDLDTLALESEDFETSFIGVGAAAAEAAMAAPLFAVLWPVRLLSRPTFYYHTENGRPTFYELPTPLSLANLPLPLCLNVPLGNGLFLLVPKELGLQ